MWHQQTEGQDAGGNINISDIPIVRNMNAQLKDNLSRPEFYERFDFNLQQLETLGCEIVAHSGIDMEIPFGKSEQSSIKSEAFQPIYDSTVEKDPSDTCGVESLTHESTGV